MIDRIEKVAANEAAFRARNSATALLETLSKCAAELGPDSELGRSAKTLVDFCYGDSLAKPVNPGPHTFTPIADLAAAKAASQIGQYAHSPHVAAAN